MSVVKVASTDDERLKIFQFRYSIYIEQQNKSYEADHENRLLFDEADDNDAELLYTTNTQNEVVSTLRVNWGYKHFREYEFMKLSLFQDFFPNDTVMFCSRLMTLPNSKIHVLKLFLKSYQLARERNVVICFAHCNINLVQFFSKLGFFDYGTPYCIDGIGNQQSMAMLLDYKQHYVNIKSPLLSLAEKFESNESNRLLFSKCIDTANLL